MNLCIAHNAKDTAKALTQVRILYWLGDVELYLICPNKVLVTVHKTTRMSHSSYTLRIEAKTLRLETQNQLPL